MKRAQRVRVRCYCDGAPLLDRAAWCDRLSAAPEPVAEIRVVSIREGEECFGAAGYIDIVGEFGGDAIDGEAVGRLFSDIDPTIRRPEVLREWGFGQPPACAHVVASGYRWADLDAGVRERAMFEHLDLEREQNRYLAVSFLLARDPSSTFDFAFEGWLRDMSMIRELYQGPWLERMREHSKSFLDTGTRALGFGLGIICRRSDGACGPDST